MTNQQVVPEALHLATASNAMADEGEMIHLLSWHEIRNLLRANAAELRRQHARIAELEAQLEAIGAGGVSGPLVGQPQAPLGGRWYMVTHDGAATLCTDREDAEKEAKDANMAWPHTAPHRAVQLVEVASVASNAEREPVAWLVCTEEGDPDMVFLSQHEAHQYLEDDERPKPLYAHPSPPGGMVGGWVAIPGTLPEPGKPVLLDIGKEYPIRAMWAAKFTLPVGLEDDYGFGEHDGLTDEWYCPEGWYEWNEHEECHWRVDKTPVAWCELPPTTSAGSGKGE